jgi:hypothetical protein
MTSNETHKYAEFVVVVYTVTTAVEWLNKTNGSDLQSESLSQDCPRQTEDPPKRISDFIINVWILFLHKLKKTAKTNNSSPGKVLSIRTVAS